ncbi:MAG: HAD family hydrolase [Bdellovibrionales bacterium]
MKYLLPKAVFWDWDGTLVDSFSFLHETHNHVRGQFGMVPFSVDVFKSYFGKPREALYTEIYGADRLEDAKAHFEAYVTANHHKIRAVDGAAAVLQAFKALDILMGIVTNKKGAFVRQEITHQGWDDYFVTVVGAGEADADKPSPAPLLLALAQSGLGLSPEEVWFVGDTDNDLACARDAGAPSVFIASPEPQHDIADLYNPILTFQSCRQFADFLLQQFLCQKF